MHFLDLTLPTLEANLALEEALLLHAESGMGGEVLRFWEWPKPAVVLGAGSKRAEDVNEAACIADGVPILRRSSGGGTVLLGKGCLLFSLVLDYDRSPLLREIPSSYRYLLGHICRGLDDAFGGMAPAGISDLAILGRKFSGNSQQRKRFFLLHHGTLLYDFNLDLVSRYLHLPARQPAYRDKRSHDSFLMNLPANADQLKKKLQTIWNVDQLLNDRPMTLVRQLIQEKYGQEDWHRRR
jgi:lipoate---protein ligase